MPAIKQLSIRHEAIMEWLIANPQKKLRECAATFGVSQAWLSCIVHSQAFQSRYRELVEENLDARVLPLREKLTGVAALGVQKLGVMIEASTDPDFIAGATDKMLHRLGYAPKTQAQSAPGAGPVQLNVFNSVSPELLEQARRARQELYSDASDAKVLEHESGEGTPVSASEEV